MHENIFAQNHKKNTRLLPKLLKTERAFDSILAKNSAYEVQIIYTQINREKDRINFVDYHYNVDKNKYFYPSNAVFLPAAVLTLEKINELSKEHDLDKHRYVRIDNATNQEILIYQDMSSENKYASFAHFIKKMFVHGDKKSCDFCYDFLNQRHFNERMHSLGYCNSWFLHKLDNKSPETSRQSNMVTFFRTDVKSYYIDIIHLKRHPTTIPFYSVYVKKGEYNPIDYYANSEENRNKFTIEDMHGFLKSLTFPDVHANKPELSDDDYAFLFKQMAHNNDFNYIMNDKLSDSAIKIFNNPGKDAGFMIDNAYIIDTRNGVDFFLSVVIKCNKTGVQEEDCKYEQAGLSFMKNVSRVVHQHAIGKKEKTVNFDDFLNKIK
jgi:hypothetical protein